MKSVEEAEDCLDTFCLVAKWGDMSARGIGDSAHVVLFGREYDDLVRRFLVAQVKRETNSTFKFKSSLMKTSTEYERQESEELAGEYWGLFSKMRTVGFFDSKYDARTSWDLCFFEPEHLQETYGNHFIFRDLRIKDADKSKTEFYLSERWGETIKIKKAQRNGKWLFIHAKEEAFYGEGKAQRVFAIAHKDDDGESCLAPEVYSDHSPKEFAYEFAKEVSR
jgi:hypothetical protein